MTAPLDRDTIVRRLVALDVPRDKAEAAADDQLGASRAPLPHRTPSVPRRSIAPASTPPAPITGVPLALRIGDELTLELSIAPRTKKNSTVLGIRQSPAYRRYRDQVKALCAAWSQKLALPLPEIPYSLEARFEVDRRGEQADLIGLLQGLCDALQDAGVVVNDRWIHALDRSRMQPAGAGQPRVVLTLRPLDALPAGPDSSLPSVQELL